MKLKKYVCAGIVLLGVLPLIRASAGSVLPETLIETVTLDSNSSIGANSINALSAGNLYRFEVSGTYYFAQVAGNGYLADGECSTIPTDTHWQKSRYGEAPDLLDVDIDGQDPNWHALSLDADGCNSSDHTYDVSYIPNATRTINFKVNDTVFFDNQGSLTIKIYREAAGASGVPDPLPSPLPPLPPPDYPVVPPAPPVPPVTPPTVPPASAQGPPGFIQTIAGNGTPGFSGDGGQATSANLYYPRGPAVDSSGNYYFADTANQRVRKVNTAGVISTVAGNGTADFAGDGGPATASKLQAPNDVAVDSSGNLYIADSYNYRVRKVNTAGVISTVAGGGPLGVYGDGGPATSVSLDYPVAVAVDSSGNLYIADSTNQRVRKVNTAGVISTVAGNGTAGYSGDGGPATSANLRYPQGVAVDSSGNLFIADASDRVRKVNTAGVISTVAGNGTYGFSGDGGPATSANLNHPEGVAVDSSGNLFIVDNGNHRIRKVNAAGVIFTVAGNGTSGYSGDPGPGTSARLNYPQGVDVDSSGNLYIADTGNHRIRKVYGPSVTVTPPTFPPDATQGSPGFIQTVAGNGPFGGFSGDGGPATSASIREPSGVAVDSSGNLFITDSSSQRVRKVNTAGVISTVAGNGTHGFSGDGGPATSAMLYNPRGVAVDSSGNLYIADTSNSRVRKVDTSGVISTVAGTGTFGFSGDGGPATSANIWDPTGVGVDSSGNLYIADHYNQRVRKVNPAGVISTVAGNGTEGFSGDGGPATSARLYRPQGVAVDSSGNLFIADSFNQRVRKVNTAGVISTVAGSGDTPLLTCTSRICLGDGGPATLANISYPWGVAVDSAGNLYIAVGYTRVRKVNRDGMISTVAGNGESGFSGDGGPAILASLGNAQGIALDSSSNLYIADYGTQRVRKVFASVT